MILQLDIHLDVTFKFDIFPERFNIEHLCLDSR